MWEGAAVPRENAHVQAGDHNTLSHTANVDREDRTEVAPVRSIVHYAMWTPIVCHHLFFLFYNIPPSCFTTLPCF